MTRVRHVVVAVFGLGAAASCGTAHHGFEAAAPPEADGGPLFNADAPPPPDCPAHCSSDLHTLLDCHERVIATCQGALGCGAGGQCTLPCDAADFNKSAVGCGFYAATVPPAPDALLLPQGYNDRTARGYCHAMLVANTWTTPATLSLDYDGKTLPLGDAARIPRGSGTTITYDPLPGGKLPAGELAVVFLSSYKLPLNNPDPVDPYFVACPDGVVPAVHDAYTATDGTGRARAFRLTTDAPVSAYDIYPYGGAKSYITSASLLLPTSAWGTNYVAVNGYTGTQKGDSSPSDYLQIVGGADGTTVTLKPASALAAGTGVSGADKGVPATYRVSRGEVLQFKQPGLGGSIIQADQPVGVISGNTCTNLPRVRSACDSLHQQLPSVQQLASEYVAARYRDRSPGAAETTPWMLVAATDGTVITLDPQIPSVGVFGKIKLQAGESVTFETSTPFVVKSQDEQHPFYAAAYMTGGDLAGSAGDPELVNLVPTGQYLRRYLFLTDPTYENTNLVFVRRHTDNPADIVLDCFGKVDSFSQVGADAEVAYVDLVHDGKPQGKCDNGAHVAYSDAPFGLTVWGYARWASYGYPAGMSTKPVNTSVAPVTR